MSLSKPDHALQYFDSLMRLMPRGFAWPKRKGTAQGAWIQAYATTLNDFELFTYRTIEQWWPHQTCSRIDEWAQAVGLPDPCFGQSDEISLRDQMLGRLRGLINLPYEDSSAAAPDVIKQLCKQIGYEVEVWYNWPFRVGRNRVGDRLGALDGQLNIRIIRVCEPFRVGVNRVGDRLVNCTQDSQDLICYLKRIVAARFAVRLIF